MSLHILRHDSCDRINIMDKNNRITTMKVKGMQKDTSLKTLNKGLFDNFNDKFTKGNTIIIDNILVSTFSTT